MDVLMYDYNMDYLDIIPTKYQIKSLQVEENQGLFTHELNIIINRHTKKAIEEAVYFGLKDPETKGYVWIYRINDKNVGSSYADFKGTHILFDDLKARGVITKTVRGGKLGNVQESREFLKQILRTYHWNVIGTQPTIAVNGSWSWATPLEIFWDVIEEADLEFYPYITIDTSTNKPKYKEIMIEPNISNFKNKFIVHGKDIFDISAKYDYTEVYNTIIPIGSKPEGNKVEGDEEKGIDTIPWEDSDRLTLEGATYSHEVYEPTYIWGKTNTNSLGIDFQLNYEHLKYPGGTSRRRVVIFDEAKTQYDLFYAGFNEGIKTLKPKVEYTANLDTDEDIQLGEFLMVERPDWDIKYFAEVFRIETDYLSYDDKREGCKKKIKFGDRITYRKFMNRRKYATKIQTT